MSELPKGWINTKIEDIAEYVQRGKSPKYIDKSDLPVINQKCIRWSGVDPRYLKFIHPDQWDSWTSERFLREGDILWNSTGTGTIGRAALYKNLDGYAKVVVDSHVTIVRANEACDSRFLHYFIRSSLVQSKIEDMQSGSTNQVELSRGQVLNTIIPIAPLNEQKRIADKLDRLLAKVDNCRERLDRISLIIKRFRQSILIAAISGDITEKWRDEHGITFRWKHTDIQTVAKVGTGSTPLRSNSSYFAENGVPWVTSAATGQLLVIAASEFVTKAAITDHRLKIYPIGTLLVAMYGEGKTRGQVTELGIEATINQACAAIVVDELLAMKKYIKLALQANYLEMREMAEGGNQPNLNLSKIKEFPLKLPSLDEQHEIIKWVEKLFDFADRLEARYQTARAQIDKFTPALLDKAFKGELVPQDPTDEPAATLLAKIQQARTNPENQTPKQPKTPRKPATPKVKMLTRSTIQPSHLADILKNSGSLTAEALWNASKLSIDDFYDQLKAEELQKLLKEVSGELSTSIRLLEAI
jgi:type I restriction enzyme, S subunit